MYNCQGLFIITSELTAQHETGPHVLPEKDGVLSVELLPPWIEQQKFEINFLTSLEPQWGHMVSFSVLPIFWRREKSLLQELQMYS